MRKTLAFDILAASLASLIFTPVQSQGFTPSVTLQNYLPVINQGSGVGVF